MLSESESESQRSLQWLRNYVEKAKKGREHAFDIRAACLKHVERSQKNGNNNKKGSVAGIQKSANQYEMLRKEEEFSEYTAFRYAEKKRAREHGLTDKDKTVPNTIDSFQDLRPKKWKTTKNKTKKEPHSDPKAQETESEEESARVVLEKEVAVVVAQIEKLIKLNAEYTPEFTSLQHIANGKAPHVVESAKSARLTLVGTRPLIAARYIEKEAEWQVATDVSFTIPRVEEGQNVAKILQEEVTETFPLDLYETLDTDSQSEVSSSQAEQGEQQDQQMEEGRHMPGAFSPVIAKMPVNTKLKSGMMWRPWRTVAAIPYNVLADPGIPAELLAASVAQLLSTGTLRGGSNLETRAFHIDLDRFYRSDCSDDEDKEWHEEEEEGSDRKPITSSDQGVS
ncbi:hypothetical protein CBR_g33945 [Chara braunii]|uniref:Uncharacterized protein n=1 Tax=Chara braunii TaxID=69332 RepID=A0A388LHL2_CHABU|nr:hypothetical protein CBR_g33945 [Chara braunii]|eukprot:GBG81767.1 hypothetical protein CBR_g33945 [Chara braunii]